MAEQCKELHGYSHHPPPEEEEEEEEEEGRHGCCLGFYSDQKEFNGDGFMKSYYCLTQLNQEFFKCAVYDSDHPSSARLMGVEYIISDRIFQVLPPDEQKLWHSHSYETTDSLWLNVRVIEFLGTTELRNLSRSYGKFWSTWQWDNGDALPLGAPSMVMPLPAVWKDEESSDEVQSKWRKPKNRERFITYVRRLKREKELKMCAYV